MTAGTRTAPGVDVFGRMPDGRAVERVHLGGASGFEVALITYGAAVQSILVPDREGRCGDVVLGHDGLDGYLARRNFFGATVGRVANRISGAAFVLDGARHELDRNEGETCLHAGSGGFDTRLWSIAEMGDADGPFVKMKLSDPDGAGGFPGRLEASVTYRLMGGNAIAMTFEATTDRATVVNLTHHGYFNLGGEEGDVLDHELTILADAYLAIDGSLLPTQGLTPVADSPFDFRRPQRIGARIRHGHEQLRLAGGYDHCYVLREEQAAAPQPAVRLAHRPSGRMLEIETDQPGIQFYSGNKLDGTVPGKGGRLHRQSDGLCLEPQRWPDAPNHADFPSARLDKGDVYRHRSIYRFSVG